MKKLSIIAALLMIVSATGLNTALAHKDGVEKFVIHVTEANPKKHNMVLNNTRSMIRSYGVGNVEIEIVAHGPGLRMFLKKTSKVQQRLQGLHAFGNVKFAVCGNTMKLLKIPKNALLDDAFVQNAIVPGGVVRIQQLQDMGYHYLRP